MLASYRSYLYFCLSRCRINSCFDLFVLTLSSLRLIKSTHTPLAHEDDDVVRERHRVLSGGAQDDVVRVENLTKVRVGLRMCWRQTARTLTASVTAPEIDPPNSQPS